MTEVLHLINPKLKFRIAEIFGPTVQGEGMHAGAPCHFVRFGGCDYRCSWCDSPHAVLPDLTAKLPKMDADEITTRLKALHGRPEWVVLSGGNPALLDLRFLVACLSESGFKIMAETQGSVYRSWLASCDEVCISPKPYSAGTWTTPSVLRMFLKKLEHNMAFWSTDAYLKVVVFDNHDYEYAQMVHYEFPEWKMFLSVGTPAGLQPTVGDLHYVERGIAGVREEVSDRFRWLAEKLARDDSMRTVRVLPQLHVLAWGIERGH